MPAPPVSHASRRPADNELYDGGCEFVEAATAIRRLADHPAAGRAMPAVLGCIEAALHALGCAAASFDDASGHAMPTEACADRMHRSLMNLGLAQSVRLRARLRRRGLDAALAGGADPWSAADLMLRD